MAMKVGTKIRKIRELKNITPKDMADRLDMGIAGYNKIERDEVSVSLERLDQLAAIFEMKPEDVLSFDEKYVFNNYGSIHAGSNGGPVTNNLPEELKKLYEDKIALLEDKIKYLAEKVKWMEDK